MGGWEAVRGHFPPGHGVVETTTPPIPEVMGNSPIRSSIAWVEPMTSHIVAYPTAKSSSADP